MEQYIYEDKTTQEYVFEYVFYDRNAYWTADIAARIKSEDYPFGLQE